MAKWKYTTNACDLSKLHPQVKELVDRNLSPSDTTYICIEVVYSQTAFLSQSFQHYLYLITNRQVIKVKYVIDRKRGCYPWNSKSFLVHKIVGLDASTHWEKDDREECFSIGISAEGDRYMECYFESPEAALSFHTKLVGTIEDDQRKWTHK